MEHEWHSLGTIAVDDQYSMGLIRRTEQELLKNDVQLAAQERMVSRKFEDVEGHLQMVRILVIYNR